MTDTVTAPPAADALGSPSRPVGRALPATGPLELDVCVVPWDVPARVSDDGRTMYTESWSPGSLTPAAVVPVYTPHVPGQLHRDGRRPIGRAHSFRTEADGYYATVTLISSAGDYHELAALYDGLPVSLEATVPPAAAGSTVARSAAAPCELTGLSVLLPPGTGAFPGAVAAARADTDDPTRPRPDPDDPDPDDPDDPEDTDVTDTATTDPTATDAAGRAAIGELVRAEVARYGLAPAGRTAPRGPLHRFDDWDALHVAARAATGETAAELSAAFAAGYQTYRAMERLAASGAVGRALVDQVTTDNPGLLPPSWITEVFGIVDRGRAGITALGGPRNPGPSGMTVNWPTYTGDLTAIVKQQLTEKTEINSVKVSFGKGAADLKTYAGGSDVSYQLQRRSTPSYMALYDRILQIAYGLTTEDVFDDALAAGTSAGTIDLTTDDDGSTVKGALFAASHRVFVATGRPATVALAASDVYVALGAQPWLQPPMYGTQNVPGTAAASTLSINISGLSIVEAWGLPAGTLIVTNEEAAGWLEEGPYLATAEDVAKLGTDVAIWGMGAPAIFLPAGVVELTVTVPTPPIPPLAAAEPEPEPDADAKSTAKK